MTLKELWERHNEHETYDIIGDYLNKPAEYRLKNGFEDYIEDLMVCPVCEEIVHEDYMTFHAWDVGGMEEYICESCRNDEEM